MLVANCVLIPKGRFSRDTHSVLTACVKNAAATLIGAQCPNLTGSCLEGNLQAQSKVKGLVFAVSYSRTTSIMSST